MKAKPTYDEIVQKADREIAKLERMLENANKEADAIMAKGPGNLSPADQKRFKELKEERKALSASTRRVALVTLEQLDKTDELRQLVESIRAVRADLEERRARIVRFAETAEAFGETLDNISDLATRIDGIREDVSHLDDPAPKKR